MKLNPARGRVRRPFRSNGFRSIAPISVFLSTTCCDNEYDNNNNIITDGCFVVKKADLI